MHFIIYLTFCAHNVIVCDIKGNRTVIQLPKIKRTFFNLTPFSFVPISSLALYSTEMVHLGPKMVETFETYSSFGFSYLNKVSDS